jgi:hypothetical protein
LATDAEMAAPTITRIAIATIRRCGDGQSGDSLQHVAPSLYPS